MDDTGAFARMLASLRTTFSERIPAGLTPTADARLSKTLKHFIREVVRVQGSLQEQEVLRETFDSMKSWYRRNTTQLLGTAGIAGIAGSNDRPEPPVIEYAVAPDLVPGGGGLASIGSTPYLEEEDPLVAFERIKAAREGRTPSANANPASTFVASTDLQSLMTMPIQPPPSVQQKDILVRQENVVKYRDVEYNLILNSKDRDWLNNFGQQNRYSFSVIPDSNKPQGASNQLIIMKQFKNITRLEFVKAILPVEALDIAATAPPLTPCCCEPPPNPCGAPPTASGVPLPLPSQAMADKAFYSVLALPFINITCNEYTGNNIGTNDSIDRSLAICQYDATWRSDIQPGEHRLNRGYTLFFPKFMKAQRLYQPTPLGTFQKLTFELLNPENQPLSRLPDSSQVAQILFSGSLTSNLTPPYSAFIDNANNYIFIRTRQWYPQWSYSKIDKITFAGLSFVWPEASVQSAGNELLKWLQNDDGHLVLGTAYTDPASSTVCDGANPCGFSNWIIIQNRMTTSTSPDFNGSCTLQPFSTATGDDTALAAVLRGIPPEEQTGGVLNLSRQVQIVLRVICRELDPATNIRPDNA